MSPLMIGIIGIIVMLILMFLRMPIAFTLIVTGVAGFMYLTDVDKTLALIQSVPFRQTAVSGLSAIPLFFLMGELVFHAGIATDLYDTARKWLGRLPGGLAMATMGAGAAFGAACGSSTAAAALFAKVAVPEMRRFNYADSMSTGAAAVAGTLSILIPPSGILIIYGILTEQSIGELFMAGFLPGILLTILYMLTVLVIVARNPQLGPPGPSSTLKEKIVSLRGVLAVMSLFLVIMGGLYVGFITPTEGGGIGAFCAFLYALGRRRLTLQGFWSALRETARTIGFIFLILVGAAFFGYFMAISGVPRALADLCTGLPVSRYVILAGVIFMYILLGCIMSGIEMMVLTLPIFYPALIALGFDPIWFGIIIVLMVEAGLLTPPFGLNVYVIAGVLPDVPMATIFRGILPYIVPILICTVLQIAFPQIALFLPSLMR